MWSRVITNHVGEGMDLKLWIQVNEKGRKCGGDVGRARLGMMRGGYVGVCGGGYDGDIYYTITQVILKARHHIKG